MAGGTHAFDMIKRLKQNEALRKLPYFKRKHEYHVAEKALGIEYKTASEEEKELLRKELLKRRSQVTKSVITSFLILAALALIIVVVVLKFVLQ